MAYDRDEQVDENLEAFWPAFTDVLMVTTVAMLFLLILVLPQIRGEEIRTDESRLGEVRGALDKAFTRNQGAATALRGAFGDGARLESDGSVSIDEAILFDPDSAEIRPLAQPALRRLATAVGDILADPEMRPAIGVIQVEGHTAGSDDAEGNWDLGARRALNVVTFLQRHDGRLAQPEFAYFLSAASYSEYRKIVPGRNRPENRRIQVRVIMENGLLRSDLEKAFQS